MVDSAAPQRTALVFGASGISGWRTVKELLVYPTSTTFSSVIAVTNRPITEEQAFFPDDPRLQLVSGIDLTAVPEAVIQSIKDKISNVSEVTHVYLYAYVHNPPEGQSLADINGRIVDNTLTALKALSPRLDHVILQTGGKVYGVEYYDKIALPPTPFNESLPRPPEQYASNILYFRQLDILARHAQGASWKWTEVRPDVITGFAPTSNAMNIAVPLGIYLTLWRAVNGKGSSVPFPGNKTAYTRTHTETPMSAAARFQIFASLKGEETNAKAFNVGASTTTHEVKWPQLANVFGLVGVAPDEEGSIDAQKWVSEHKDAWLRLEKAHGLKTGVVESTGWDFMRIIFSVPFNREYDTTRSRGIGFKEDIDVLEAYKEAWSQMADAKVLPRI